MMNSCPSKPKCKWGFILLFDRVFSTNGPPTGENPPFGKKDSTANAAESRRRVSSYFVASKIENTCGVPPGGVEICACTVPGTGAP